MMALVIKPVSVFKLLEKCFRKFEKSNHTLNSESKTLHFKAPCIVFTISLVDRGELSRIISGAANDRFLFGAF